jgi:hypothetical protein
MQKKKRLRYNEIHNTVRGIAQIKAVLDKVRLQIFIFSERTEDSTHILFKVQSFYYYYYYYYYY